MDTLSCMLSLFKPQTFISAGLDAGGQWGIQFPPHEGIKFNAVLKGACWLQVADDPQSYYLQAGDCFLLTSGKPFVLAADLDVERMPSAPIYDHAVNHVAVCNRGGDFFLVGARFHFQAAHTRFLFGQLPPVVYVPAERDQAAVLRWGLDQFTKEFLGDLPGRNIFIEHLAPIMLLQTLRVHLAAGDVNYSGWLAAATNTALSKALDVMHGEPGVRWTVAVLAKKAGLSRAGFALKFKQLVGMSPMDYLLQWRMLLACQYLQDKDRRISDIAYELGYESESAFSAAFKRVNHCAPREYVKRLTEMM